MERNAISFYTIDREDPNFYGALVFRVNNTKTNQDAYNEIKHKLESPEFIKFFLEEKCLLDEEDYFNGDETYKFKSTCWKDYGLYLEFINSENDIVEYRMEAEFIYLID